MAVARATIDVEVIGQGNLDFLGSVSIDEANIRKYEVADSTTDEAVNVAGVAAVDVFAVKSDQAVSYKLNGSSDAVTLDANGFHALFGTNITAMTVTNASGSTANIEILMAGT